MNEHEDEIEIMDFLNIIWKRKWLIIIPTFVLVVAVGVYSFFLPQVWEVDAIISPAKLFVQTEDGFFVQTKERQFQEIMVVDTKQIARQINEESYNKLIASELNLDIREIPKLKADNLRDTKLLKISTKVNDVEKAKLILYSLFTHLKRDLDKKIDVEIKGFDTQIATNENLIKNKELVIKDKLSDIKINQIEKNKTRQEILSAENKLKISEDRVNSIIDEMKAVKERTDELEKQLKKALAEKKEGSDAANLFLYSNEVQHNLRYYNTLDEKLSNEKITQENLKLLIKEKNEEIKQLDTQTEKLKTGIDKINNEIDNVKNQIGLLNERKATIDYAQLIKEPTSSFSPVSPKKKRNVMIAGILGLMIFTMLAFFLEYIEKQKLKVKD